MSDDVTQPFGGQPYPPRARRLTFSDIAATIDQWAAQCDIKVDAIELRVHDLRDAHMMRAAILQEALPEETISVGRPFQYHGVRFVILPR